MRSYIRRSKQTAALAARGFTLIELLLVLVILGVLAALVMPKFTGSSEKAKIAAAKADVATLRGAIGRYEITVTHYPAAEEGGLQALISQSGTIKGWSGPYLELESLPKDPWGKDYIYRLPGQHNPNGYDVFSCGPDGQEGTDDDIGNWTTSN